MFTAEKELEIARAHLQRLKVERDTLINEKHKAEDNSRKLTSLLEERAH